MIGRILLVFAFGTALPVATADEGTPQQTKPKCSVTFDKGSPKATLLADGPGWVTTAAGAYKIDPGFKFQELQIQMIRRDRKNWQGHDPEHTHDS